MPIPLARVHAIRAILTMAGAQWRSAIADVPEILRTSKEDARPEVVWLTDTVEHVSGSEHSVLYRDYLTGQWYTTGSALTGGPVRAQHLTTQLPGWSRPLQNRRPTRED